MNRRWTRRIAFLLALLLAVSGCGLAEMEMQIQPIAAEEILMEASADVAAGSDDVAEVSGELPAGEAAEEAAGVEISVEDASEGNGLDEIPDAEIPAEGDSVESSGETEIPDVEIDAEEALPGEEAAEEVSEAEVPNVEALPEDGFAAEADDAENPTFTIQAGILYGYHGTDSHVVIPEGVVEIGDGVFREMEISSVSLPSTLKHIGDQAFYKCKMLESVAFPDGLVSIGNEAFFECKELGGVAFPDSLRAIGNRAFSGIFIGSVDFGGGVEEIGDYAFYRHRLGAVKLPGSVKTIGEGAFLADMGDMTEVVIGEGTVRIGRSAFATQGVKKVTLPASLEEIADDAFYYTREMMFYLRPDSYAQRFCEEKGYDYRFYGDYTAEQAMRIEDGVLVKYIGEAAEVVIPESVNKIGDKAFYGNEKLVNVRFHDGVTHIGASAFQNCALLADVVLPAKLESIGNYAFKGCISIRSISFPASLQDTGLRSFEGCTALESAVISEGVSQVSSSFVDCTSLVEVSIPVTVQIISESFSGCTSLKEVKLPYALTSIGNYSFKNCSALETLEIPAGVQRIEYGAFEGCSKLDNVTLPAGITRVSGGLFRKCTSLSSIVIPGSVYEIMAEAFRGCTSLREAYVPANVKEIGKDAFADCPGLTVYGAVGSAAQKYCEANNIYFDKPSTEGSSIAFVEEEVVLGVGQKLMLETYVDSVIPVGALKFSSSYASVASVNKTTGELTAKKAGTATITVKSETGLKATCKVTVKAAPKSVSLAYDVINIAQGEKVKPEYSLSKDSVGSVRFETANTFVAGIDEELGGLVVGVTPGTTELKVTTHNGKSDRCTINVLPVPEEIYLEEGEISLRATTEAQLKPYVNAESVCNRYIFISSDPGIVQVDENGRLLGISQGSAEVTACVAVAPALRAVCRVNVLPAPPKVLLDAEEITLGVKESYALDARYDSEETDYGGAFSYKSSNEKVVSVSGDGVITAKKKGSAVVTVTSEDGLSASCRVTVQNAPTSVKLTPAKTELGVGQSVQLRYALSKNSAGSVRFESSDPNVLTVNESGMATAVAPGTAKVRVMTYNGRSAAADVTVHAAPESVALDYPEGEISLGLGMKGTFKLLLSEGSFGGCSFASSNSNVVGVDPDTGKFEVRTVGETVITVTTYNGLSDSRRVKTTVKPAMAKYTESELTMGVGESYTPGLQSFGKDYAACAPAFSFKSSNAKVAAVDANGMITAKKQGSATITATTYNGVKASCKITVKKVPTKLELNVSELYLGNGEEFQLKAGLGSGAGAVVRYESSDPSKLAVYSGGRIQGKADSGTVVVTASTYNGYSASCTVELHKEPHSVSLPYSRLYMNVGMKLPLEYKFVEGSSLTLNYYNTNSKAVELDKDWNLVAKRAGRAEITLETYNGRKTGLLVIVQAAPSKYTLKLPETLEVGKLYNILNYYGSDRDTRAEHLFKDAMLSNGKARMIRNSLGVYLLPLEEGDFALTVKSYNGKTVKQALTAVDAGVEFVPEISSKLRADGAYEDFEGRWKLRYVCAGGNAYPPESFALYSSLITVTQNYTTVNIGEWRESQKYFIEDGVLILLSNLGEYTPFFLHENGMLSLVWDEDVVMWFEKQW